jgi:hypothetical protein
VNLQFQTVHKPAIFKKAASRPKTSFPDYRNSGRQSNPFFGQFQRLGPIELISLSEIGRFRKVLPEKKSGPNSGVEIG